MELIKINDLQKNKIMNATNEELIISKLYMSIKEYQKINNITGECIANCQYFYDCIYNNFYDYFDKVEVKNIFTCLRKNGNLHCWGGHMVVMLDDEIFDLSYEINSKNPKYFTTYKTFQEYIKNNLNNHPTNKEFKTILNRYFEFGEYAININNKNYKYVLCHDKNYYSNMADYIEEIIKEFNEKSLYEKKLDIIKNQIFK